MKREQGSTLFLKAVIILIGIAVLSLCIWLPVGAREAADSKTEYAYLQYILLLLYVTAIPFYFALYQAFKLLQYIDRNEAFSEMSVKALKTIKHCAFAISILYVAGLPLFYFVAEKDDAPGVLALALVIIFASIVISTCVAVLQKLLKNAIDIKSENDLTI
ncbi:DUF2975 domain-containing protein [Lihuaxuella thermophila]|uniref:DUF2975 domain-containing protein n=1 Tax=Lihuaxuella thermophila TaxID=1173111 RepID=A0A1H8AFM3_9BACL|nr:DUF2975 domain-containing protein [Lihuaxuella thermophila]SEM68337.1 Protein of unknown function [Lihuaxuella thermophila]